MCLKAIWISLPFYGESNDDAFWGRLRFGNVEVSTFVREQMVMFTEGESAMENLQFHTVDGNSNNDVFLATSWDAKELKSKFLTGNGMGMFFKGNRVSGS